MESYFTEIRLKFEKYIDSYPNIANLWIIYLENMLKQYKEFNASVEHSLSILESGVLHDLEISTIATLFTISRQPISEESEKSEESEDGDGEGSA